MELEMELELAGQLGAGVGLWSDEDRNVVSGPSVRDSWAPCAAMFAARRKNTVAPRRSL